MSFQEVPADDAGPRVLAMASRPSLALPVAPDLAIEDELTAHQAAGLEGVDLALEGADGGALGGWGLGL